MAEEKKQEQAPAQAAPEAKQKKNKKIGRMNLKEVEKKLNSVREKMGRLDSRYAKELLKRKSVIASEAKPAASPLGEQSL